jgi:3-oxoacyl-[acyl-carrier-protein] synthase II
VIDVSATVVGAGVVSPGGSTLEDLWSSICRADGTNAEVVRYSELGDEVPVLTCRARGFEPADRLERHEIRRLDRSHQMAFWAADDALESAPPEAPPPERCAVVVGTGFGAAGFQESQERAFTERGFRGISPLSIPVVMPNSIAAHLSMRYGFQGPSLTVAAACASGAMALGEALWLLRSGRADRVLAGGVDALLTLGVSASFARMEAMSTRFDDPCGSSRPFDLDRDGFVLAEGAAFVVLERASDSSTGIGRILGYATNSDAHHIVAPPERGEGAAACMRAALEDAGLVSDDVGHINAHGTSTDRNDRSEAFAIHDVFGQGAVPVTSSKGVLGHTIGAAGAIEALIAMESNRRGVVPPTANLTRADPEITAVIDVVGEPRAIPSRISMSNSFAFGGHNACLVLG